MCSVVTVVVVGILSCQSWRRCKTTPCFRVATAAAVVIRVPLALANGACLGSLSSRTGDISASFDTMEQLRFGKKVRGPRASTSGDFPIDIADLPSTTPRKGQLQPLDHRLPSSTTPQSLVKLEPLGGLLKSICCCCCCCCCCYYYCYCCCFCCCSFIIIALVQGCFFPLHLRLSPQLEGAVVVVYLAL
jgi:hypothetical protein